MLHSSSLSSPILNSDGQMAISVNPNTIHGGVHYRCCLADWQHSKIGWVDPRAGLESSRSDRGTLMIERKGNRRGCRQE